MPFDDMTESCLDKLKHHKILLVVLSVIYSVLATLILTRPDFSGEDFAGGFCWFLTLLVLLTVAACFDKYSQPYLYVCKRSITLVPWAYFVGFTGAIAISHFANSPVLGVVFLFILEIAALAFYFCLMRSAGKMSEEEVRRAVAANLIKLDSRGMDFLLKSRKFYRWNGIVPIAVVIAVGKFAVLNKWVYTTLLALVFIYNIVSFYKVYSIKYASQKSAAWHLAADALVCAALLAFSVLLDWNVIPVENMSGLDIALPACFGLITFAKQSSFAYFAVEHERMRKEFENE